MCTKFKICSLPVLLQRTTAWKTCGKTIVFTNGCFDILHFGHVSYLEQAKSLGDILVVAINSDLSVKTNKGISRPIIKENDRASLLAALACIDAVIVFNETTPLQLIQKIMPTVLVKGGDYDLLSIVGKEAVEKNGGKVLTIPFEQGYSTSNIIDKIHACAK